MTGDPCEYTRAPEPVSYNTTPVVGVQSLPLGRQGDTLTDLSERVEALERLAASQARDIATLRENDARLTQENIALRQKVHGTGGRAWEGQPLEW